jgi:hypothetical protein
MQQKNIGILLTNQAEFIWGLSKKFDCEAFMNRLSKLADSNANIFYFLVRILSLNIKYFLANLMVLK